MNVWQFDLEIMALVTSTKLPVLYGELG